MSLGSIRDLMLYGTITFYDEHLTARPVCSAYNFCCDCNKHGDITKATKKFPLSDIWYTKFYEITGSEHILIEYRVGVAEVDGAVTHTLFRSLTIDKDIINEKIRSNTDNVVIMIGGEIIGVDETYYDQLVFIVNIQKIKGKWFIAEITMNIGNEAAEWTWCSLCMRVNQRDPSNYV